MTDTPTALHPDTRADSAPAPGVAVPIVARLPRPTATRLRSTLVVPSLPRVLSELAQNALDARASRVECWVSLVPGAEGVRVEDDGVGMDVGRVGVRYETTKPSAASHLAPIGSYGFRGEALASISALALVEVTSRVARGASMCKIVKNGTTLYTGPARNDLPRAHGTTVAVRDLFNAVPVRQAALTSAPTTVLAACRRVIEGLALANPSTRWTLWEDRPVGARKILSLQGAKNSVDVFRTIYGMAGVDKVQKIRVSAGDRRVDGFISLEGGVTKSHQHLYVNGYPLEASELHQAIARRFAQSQFATVASDLTDDHHRHSKRPSPRRLIRHPIYVLNVTLPADEVDAAYEPGKSILGYKDTGQVKAFVLAVIDDYLRRHGFITKRSTSTEDVSPCPSPSKRTLGPSPFKRTIGTGRATGTPPKRQSLAPRDATGGIKRLFSERVDESLENSAARPAADLIADSTAASLDLSAPNWIQELERQVDDSVLAIRRGTPLDEVTDNPTRLTLAPPSPLSDITFSRASLSSPHVRILRQVDRKFVPCVLRGSFASGPPKRVLVVLDQHAADERAAVEGILHALCEGFASDTLATTSVDPDVVRVVLTRREVEALALPGVLAVLQRWGIDLAIPAPEGEYVQVGIRTVPALLDRLARRQGTEMKRLLKLYLPVLAEGMGEVQALMASLDGMRGHTACNAPREKERGESGEPRNDNGTDDTTNKTNGNVIAANAITTQANPTTSTVSNEPTHQASNNTHSTTQYTRTPYPDTTNAAPTSTNDDDDNTTNPDPKLSSIHDNSRHARIQTWMPAEMVELANSKACRGAIMFEDRLAPDQCARLVSRLAACRNPWICAHGRPTLAPLRVIDGQARGRRVIDWKAWAVAESGQEQSGGEGGGKGEGPMDADEADESRVADTDGNEAEM